MINYGDLAHEVLDEILDYTFDEALANGNLSFYLPVQWSECGDEGGDGVGGPPVEDPLTIYASWDVSGYEERVTFKTSLYELLEDTYELFTELDGVKTLETDGIEIFERIRSSLLFEVQRIDYWIEKAKQEKGNEQTISSSDLHAQDV